MKTIMILACLVASTLFITFMGCTDNMMARSWGGESNVNLPCGEKLSMVTWKNNDLWLMTREMMEEESAKSYKFAESSSWGMMEGQIIIKECVK